MSVLKRLTVLHEDAGREPVPQRKFFHLGQPEVLDDVGECIPMISWVDDNLSRYVVSDTPSSAWGRASPRPRIFVLPNRSIKVEDGLFLISGAGEDRTVPHPNGKGSIHFVHLGAVERLWDRGIAKIYVYRLDGVQVKSVAEKRRPDSDG
jgi:hypothetical protein